MHMLHGCRHDDGRTDLFLRGEKKKKKKETFCKHSAMFAKRNPTIKKKQKCVNARDRTWASEENTLARYRDNHSATLTGESSRQLWRVFYV